EDRVLARHGHVVQEHVALGAAPDGRGVLVQQEGRAGVRPTLDEKESLSALEFVVRERELIVDLLFSLDRGKRDGDVLLKGMSALGAEARIVTIGMSTIGTEHREPFVGPGSSWRSREALNPRPSTPRRSYRTVQR